MTSTTRYLRNELKAYLAYTPDATPDEIAQVSAWVKEGNSPYDNPFLLCMESGWPMDFISALRVEREFAEDVPHGDPSPPDD